MRTNKTEMDYLSLVVAAMLFLCANAQRAMADGANNFTQTNWYRIFREWRRRRIRIWSIRGECRSVPVRRSGSLTTERTGDTLQRRGRHYSAGSQCATADRRDAAPAPTGQVFNGIPVPLMVHIYIFSTEGGTITGWRGAPGTTAESLSPGTGGVYKGLAMGTTPNGTYLYATDFHKGQITVFTGTGAPIRLERVISPIQISRRAMHRSTSRISTANCM